MANSFEMGPQRLSHCKRNSARSLSGLMAFSATRCTSVNGVHAKFEYRLVFWAMSTFAKSPSVTLGIHPACSVRRRSTWPLRLHNAQSPNPSSSSNEVHSATGDRWCIKVDNSYLSPELPCSFGKTSLVDPPRSRRPRIRVFSTSG